MSGCRTIQPKPLTENEIRKSGQLAATEASKDVEPLTGPLSVEEAMARALKYNMDQRVKMLEQAIALGTWEAGRFDLLPKVTASAGYRSRDEDLTTRSIDSVTGLPSLANPFISSERSSTLYDLGVSWSVLDFTMGYYTAKQNSDRILIAAETRRQAMHALNRDVTIAFWRMASAQRLRDDVNAALASAEQAIADSEQAKNEAIQAPVEQLRYQRQLLENVRLLASIDKEFATARVTLAKLINLPVNLEFTVEEPAVDYSNAILDVNPERLEEIALERNAELRQSLYGERIAAIEVRKAMARLLPNLSLGYNIRHSDDSFLINQTWNEASVAISQNLTNLLSLPANRRRGLAEVELARQKTIAMQMAVIAQVHVARINLAGQIKQLELADRIWGIDDQIKKQMENRQSEQAISQLSRVASDTAAIVSLLRRYQALAEFHSASGTLQSTLGMEVDLNEVQDRTVAELTADIRSWMSTWRSAEFSNADTHTTFDLESAREERDELIAKSE